MYNVVVHIFRLIRLPARLSSTETSSKGIRRSTGRRNASKVHSEPTYDSEWLDWTDSDRSESSVFSQVRATVRAAHPDLIQEYYAIQIPMQ